MQKQTDCSGADSETPPAKRLISGLFHYSSPVLLHFLTGQVLAYLSLWLVRNRSDAQDAYIGQVMTVTGLTGLLTGFFLLVIYHRDHKKRIIKACPDICPVLFPSLPQILLLLMMGAGLAQYMNLLMVFVGKYLPQGTYYEDMAAVSGGKSLLSMIFWMGIAAPFGEEMVFRVLVFLRLRDHLRLLPSAILSAVFFGVYHGNIIQGIYAGILGLLFALIMEWSGCLTSSFFLHAGANIWMLIVSEYAWRLLLPPWDRIYFALSTVMILSIFAGFRYYHRFYRSARADDSGLQK